VTKKLSLKELGEKSHEELLAIAQQVTELKKARQFKKLDYYLKNAHAGQQAFHKNNHRIRFVFASNRSGKSTGGAAEFIWLNLGTHPYKKCKIPIKSCIVVQDFENHAKNILEPKINEWAPQGSIRKIERHQGGAVKKIHWSSGSTTDVYSHDQDMKVFEGSDYDLAWFDEPPPLKIWNAIWRGMTDRGGSMYMTGTPLACAWLYNKYKEIEANNDPLCWYVRFPKNANARNLGQGDEQLGLKRIEEMLSQYDEGEREARGEGGFIQLQGLIFKNWDRSKHLINQFNVPASWPIIESIDPHPSKPWSVVWIGLAPNGTKILLQAKYIQGTIDDVANGILMGREQLPMEAGVKPKIQRILIDNMASVPTWQKSFTDPTARRISVRDELENMIGPVVGAPRIEVCPKNVSGKIELFKRWLSIKDRGGRSRADFYVFDTEENLETFVWEIERYAWAKFKGRDREGEVKTQPVKKDDDIMDAVMQVALTLGEQPDEVRDVVDMTGGFGGYGSRGAHGRGATTGFFTRQNAQDFSD
jgi:hypothetical protein